MRTSIKNYKLSYLFLLIILLSGIITGIIFFLMQDIITKNDILVNLNTLFTENIFNFSNIFIHLGILILIFLSSFIFLGIPIYIIYLFFEGISIGFVIPIFIKLYKFKCFFYLPLYLILIKIVFIVLLFILFTKLIFLNNEYFNHLKIKTISYFPSIKSYFKIVLCILVNDLFIFGVSNKILIFLFG